MNDYIVYLLTPIKKVIAKEESSELKFLKQARAIIADEKNWTKGMYARLANDAGTTVKDPNAEKFCIMGAVYRALHVSGEEEPVASPISTKIMMHLNMASFMPITQYNDSVDHRTALAKLDEVISNVERESCQS